MLKKIAEKREATIYFVFRLIVGILFFQHGFVKLFGGFGKTAVDLTSLMGAAGVIELLVGLFIAIGLFTRVSAVLGAITMTTAFFMVHYPKSFNPMTNGGELAVMYLAAFLVIFVFGGKKWALDNKIFKE